MAFTEEEINKRFDYHPPLDERTKRAHEQVRESCKLQAEVLNYLPDSREKSLAFTALEECMMWANAAIARNGLV